MIHQAKAGINKKRCITFGDGRGFFQSVDWSTIATACMGISPKKPKSGNSKKVENHECDRTPPLLAHKMRLKA